MFFRILPLFVLAFGVLAAPAAASASAGASVTGGVLSYVASGPESSMVTVTSGGGAIVIADQGVQSITAGSGCRSTGVRQVSCPADAIASISADLGDGDDTISVALFFTPATVHGGPGSDTISGSAVDDALYGDGGSDTISGGWGNDRLDGGSEADRLYGNGGSDTVTYASRGVPVTVTVDSQADDGAAGEGDLVDAENVEGGSADDSLTGDGNPNKLSGGDGADTLSGAYGGDVLDGGAGADSVDGGAGDDSIAARDGTADGVTCGDGADAVVADTADSVGADCESVDKPSAPTTPVTPPPGDTPATPDPVSATPDPGPGTADPVPVTPRPHAPLTDAPAVEVGRRSITVSPSGALGIGLGCPADAGGACRGSIVLMAAKPIHVKGLTAARRRKIVKVTRRRKFSIAAGAKKTVQLQLARRSRASLKRRRWMVVSAVVTQRTGDGESTTSSKTLTLRAARRGVRRSGRR